MKKIILSAISLFFCIAAFAQTQQGYVRTAGRHGAPGQAISDVRVRADGPYNMVMTDSQGQFSLTLDGLKEGDPYALKSVQKSGYELLDKSAVGRKYGVSSTVPLALVLVNSEQVESDKQMIAKKMNESMLAEYRRQVSELEASLKSGKVDEERYRSRLSELNDQVSNNEKLIEDLADRYARTDYDSLDSLSKEVNWAIEQADFVTASALLKKRGDSVSLLAELESAESALASVRESVTAYESDLEKRREKTAALRRSLENDLLNLHTICAARYQRDSAYYYLKKLVEFTPENPDNLETCGIYALETMALYNEALELSQKAL
ncbi:MAG: hypothetical protein MJY67_08450, partial [Bacteroidales bacterium]|nr:hypothetical protein [Bacteroidales bacterium]